MVRLVSYSFIHSFVDNFTHYICLTMFFYLFYLSVIRGVDMTDGKILVDEKIS